MRGDAPYLGVVAPGRLDVYQISLDNLRPQEARIRTEASAEAAQTVFSRLANIRPKPRSISSKWISQVILKLIERSICSLKKSTNISDEDIISLIGRALFVRFLADRNLTREIESKSAKSAHQLFSDRDTAVATSGWLDETFNGDFLPLSSRIFENITQDAFRALSDILYRAPDGQLAIEWKESWANLDFAHIPVGVLSQAYELYLRKHDPIKQRVEGGYYTPRPIADLMVRGSILALSRDGSDRDAKVLDPSAGAGVFLLTAFRHLVRNRWELDGKRPDTQALRKILYNQITGFDINEAALRFAALGLYLISIELDPDPEPVQKLKFECLRKTVLVKVGSDSGNDVRRLGSLGPDIGPEHKGKYDLVIGNPPWTGGTQLPHWHEVKNAVRAIALGRLPSLDIVPPIPNEALDLPFVWRAMEWTRPGGQIAFALHARVLFQNGDGMQEARRCLFAALNVTAVVNGVELRQTKVWPEISAPFCLLYAKNEVPNPGSAFRLVSPRLESSLNNDGAMRIDAANAELISHQQVAQNPTVLKTLFRGGPEDLRIFERMSQNGLISIGGYWNTRFARKGIRSELMGNGYQKLRPSSKASRNEDGERGQAADFLLGLPVLVSDAAESIIVETGNLPKFGMERVHRRRNRALYRAPLLLVHQSPPANGGRIRIAVADRDLAFSETFYGYSASQHPHGNELVRFLSLIIGSRIALWLTLITSGKFGFEREVVEKSTIDHLLVPNFDHVSESDVALINSLFDAVANNEDYAWDRVDEWASGVYGLRQRDLQTISDTLDYGLPFSENRHLAQESPSDQMVADFCDVLNKELAPWGKRFEHTIVSSPIEDTGKAPWRGVYLQSSKGGDDAGKCLPDAWAAALRLADHLAATEVTFPGMSRGSMILGRLDQARYWTKTQARRAAESLVWNHVELLSGKFTEQR
ncbi:hypothetical protein LFADAHJC_LOCUS2463 [Methylorubrum extorquens]